MATALVKIAKVVLIFACAVGVAVGIGLVFSSKYLIHIIHTGT